MQSCHACQISLLANEEESIYGYLTQALQAVSSDRYVHPRIDTIPSIRELHLR